MEHATLYCIRQPLWAHPGIASPFHMGKERKRNEKERKGKGRKGKKRKGKGMKERKEKEDE